MTAEVFHGPTPTGEQSLLGQMARTGRSRRQVLDAWRRLDGSESVVPAAQEG